MPTGFKTLGIDIGTKTGWALFEGDTLVRSGVQVMSPTKKEPQAVRLIKAGEFFTGLMMREDPDLVVFEKVYRWMSSESAFIYNALLGQLLIACHHHRTEHMNFAPTSLKKFATGKGNAPKVEMVKAANKKYGVQCKTDDEADAIWLGAYGYDSYRAGK